MDPFLTSIAQLPLLAPGQAQKEVTHNEALILLDLLLGGQAVAAGTNVPPASATPGQCWIVGAAPTGDWAGRAHTIAGWTAGGWRFIVPWRGLALHVGTNSTVHRYDGSVWAAAPIVAAVEGGTVVDSQARAAIGSILAAMLVHGLLTPA